MIDWHKTAAIFPGQGSQMVGMGRDFAQTYEIARQTFAQADDMLGFPLSRICWEDPEQELNQTVNTQPALYVCSVAIWRVLKQLIPQAAPARMAGHSLGEFSALTAAGAMSFEDGLRLVYARGSLMQQAGKDNPGAMAALLALDVKAVEALCAEVSQETGFTVVIANDNCPGQVVVSGHSVAVERLIERAPDLGARRAVKLAVSVAAHSPLMASARGAFQEAIQATRLNQPQAQVIGNVRAQRLNSAQEIRLELEQQLTQNVRWSESMQAIIAQGAEHFIEIGSGAVLSGLMRRIDRNKTRITLDTIAAWDSFFLRQE